MIDGSYKDGVAGAGLVLRDDAGSITFSACSFYPHCAEGPDVVIQELERESLVIPSV